LTPDEREQAVSGLLRLVNEFGSTTERFFGRIYRGLDRKNGEPRPGVEAMLPTTLPSAVNPGDVTALHRLHSQINERMQEAQSLVLRLQAVFASISEGVIVQDHDGRIMLMNDAAHRLIGGVKQFRESELGTLYRRAQHLPTLISEMETLGSPVRVQVNNRILGAQIAVIAPDGMRLGTMIVVRDVTKEALADRLKDEFITQITHELRTPLTAIKGMSEVLLNQPTDRPPNRKFLEAIGRNAAIVDRMIIELLDISEITAGTFSVRQYEIDLDELIYDVLRGEEPRLRKANLHVGIMYAHRARTHIVGDDRRLRWALGHLLDNSINYTPEGGQIMVRVGAVRGDRVLVQVKDSGVGINDKDLPHIFERFYRGQARTTQGKVIDPRGLGQGLYIARAVAEAHGGYLVVSSTPGQGSLFTMGLPFVPPT
jgi:signal transduction histidine kinase